MFAFVTLLRYHQRIARKSVITCDAELHIVSVVTYELSGRKKETNDGIIVCSEKMGLEALSVRHV